MSDANPSNPKTEDKIVGEGKGKRSNESVLHPGMIVGGDQNYANPQNVGGHGDGRGDRVEAGVEAGVEAEVEVKAGGDESAVANEGVQEEDEGEGRSEEEAEGDDDEETGKI